MAFDTKFNLNSNKFEQLSGDTLNISGTTRSYGKIEYGGNYSEQFTSRSLVDKSYVDGYVISGGSFAFGNGLTNHSGFVRLGGTLTGETTIFGGGNTLNFGEPFSNDLDQLNISLAGDSDWDFGNSVYMHTGNFGSSLYMPNDRIELRAAITGPGSGVIYIGGGSSLGLGIGMTVNNGDPITLSAGGANPVVLTLNNVDGGFLLEDNRTGTGQTGLQYAADYSANFGPRSIPDVAWVTGQTGSGGTAGWGDMGENKFLYDSTYESSYEKTYSVVFGATGTTDYDQPYSTSNPNGFSNAVKSFIVQTYGTGNDSFIGLKSHGYNGGEEYYLDSEAKLENQSIKLTSTSIARFYYDNNQLDMGDKTVLEINNGNGEPFTLTYSNMDDSTIYAKVMLDTGGFKYDADYSATFGPRSIPDAAWVTGQTGGGGSGSTSAGNGLHKTGSVIKLGGYIEENTTIGNTGYTIQFGGEKRNLKIDDTFTAEVTLQNDNSIYAPDALFDAYPAMTFDLWYDSGTTTVIGDLQNFAGTSGLFIVPFQITYDDFYSDNVGGLNYDGNISSYVPIEGEYTFYPTPLPTGGTGMITLMYVYSANSSPRGGSFILIDNASLNENSNVDSKYNLNAAVGGAPTNIRNFIANNYIPFPITDAINTAKLTLDNNGNMFVENTNGSGLQLYGSYDNTTLLDTSYVPKNWVKERLDIITGTTATLNNGLTLKDSGAYTWGGDLTGDTVVNGVNFYGVRFKDVDSFDMNIRSVGINIGNSPGFIGQVIGLSSADNDKVFVSGSFRSYSGITGYSGSILQNIVKLNEDRSLDTSFKIDGTGFGKVTTVDYVICTRELSDGSIMAGGTFSGYNENGCYQLAKLNSDGSENTAWTANAGVGLTPSSNSFVQTIVEYTGNTVLIGGGVLFTWNEANFPGGGNNCFRLNSNGTIDTTFKTGSYGGVGGAYVSSIIVMPDGKIFTAGYFGDFSGVTCNGYVMRLPNGEIDPTFKLSGVTNQFDGFGTISQAILLQNGDIAMCGSFILNGDLPRTGLTIISSNGDVKTSFYASGHTEVFNTRTIIEQANGKLVVGYGGPAPTGYTSNGFLRFNLSGSIDPTFNPGGSGFAKYDDEFENWQYPLVMAKINAEEDMFIIGEFLTLNGAVAYNFTKVNSGGTLIVNDNPAFVVKNTTVEYSDNRHHLYNDRTLVDKEYVDNCIDAINGDEHVHRTASTGSTVGTSSNDIGVIGLVSGSTFSVETTITGSDGTDRAMFKIQGLFYNDSGTPQQVGSTVSLITPVKSAGASAWTAVYDIVGDILRVTVTGDTGQNVKWFVVSESHQLLG